MARDSGVNPRKGTPGTGRTPSREEWDWFMERVGVSAENGRELAVTAQGRITSDPFRVLIATLISLRTRDEVTETSAERLFEMASTPARMVEIGADAVARAIFPANYYPTKAGRIVAVSRILLERFDGSVPSTIQELLSLPGVGRKTANLVLSEGFGIDAICVDTHVHRIPNRFGIIETRDPAATEEALRRNLPIEYWIRINRELVPFGKSICTPTSPRCSICPLAARCSRVFKGPSR